MVNTKIRGEALEEQLGWLHARYEANGQATVVYNGTQAEKKKRKKNGKTVIEWVPKKSKPDFEGCITVLGGKHVLFDSKRLSLEAKAYNHPLEKLHQTDYLWRFDKAGTLAFLLIVVDTADLAGARGWIAFPDERWRLEANKGFTIHLNEQECYQVPAWADVFPGYIPDWLKFIEDYQVDPARH